MSLVAFLFMAAGLAVFVLGLQTFAFLPLALVYEFRAGRARRRLAGRALPSVTVVVPAHNEEETIAESVRSILSSDYPDFEVIVVDDGSTDRTGARLASWIETGTITYLRKSNGGKASALNAGIALARKEIILFTDADSLFPSDTLYNMARWFTDPSVDAVSGNDEVLHPSTSLQKLLVLTTHIGSGFVRRALSLLGVLPVISGNLGAVRRTVLLDAGGFSDLWGEDLDLTFKLHKAGAGIIFDPAAKVLCDAPATLPSLWRQRVRWMRSFLKICSLHRDLFFSPRFSPFSLYLPILWLNMVVVPLLQIVALVLLPAVLHSDAYQFGGALEVVAYSGIGVFFTAALFGIMLDRAYHHLKYLPLHGWLIVPFSYLYDAVLVYSVYREIGGAAEEWAKTERRRLDAVSPARAGFAGYAVWLGLAGAVAAVLAFTYLPGKGHGTFAAPVGSLPGAPTIAVATHFDAWGNPEDAIRSIAGRREAALVSLVGVEAGRVEWNYFRWEGHASSWSNDQRTSGNDLLEDAVESLRSRGKATVAILDFYAPLFLSHNRWAAAVDGEGNASSEQVCFMELTEGAFGKSIIAMATYLASHYDLEGISVTELEYNRYCYDERCLASFAASTGRHSWPHRFLSSTVDRENREIGEWRSHSMAGFLKVLADSVHKYGKKLYVDVPMHESSLGSEGRQGGLFYPALLQFSDAIIVWDYFSLDGRSPSSSEDIARFFTSRYDPARVIISIGLWGGIRPVGAGEMSDAVRYALAGGAQRLWITPNHLMTDDHWKRLDLVLAPCRQGALMPGVMR